MERQFISSFLSFDKELNDWCVDALRWWGDTGC